MVCLWFETVVCCLPHSAQYILYTSYYLKEILEWHPVILKINVCMYVKGLFDCSALWDRVSRYSVQFANIVSQHTEILHTVHDKFDYSELNSDAL